MLYPKYKEISYFTLVLFLKRVCNITFLMDGIMNKNNINNVLDKIDNKEFDGTNTEIPMSYIMFMYC